MATTQPHRTPEDLVRLGAEAFDRHVRPTLRPEDDDKFVAIDLVTSDHEFDADDYAAVMRLGTRRPSADIWLARVGQPVRCRLRRCP